MEILNSSWIPAAVLPNIYTEEPIEGEGIALVGPHDTRVADAHAKFKEFLSRFTDAFHVELNPVTLMVREDLVSKLSRIEPLASFRDLVALCVIPYARSLRVMHPQRHAIFYSNSFWLYPWMLDTTNEHLVARTPAVLGLHVVEDFHGQSSPDLPQMQLRDLDKPLFAALHRRWTRYYLGSRQGWGDRALFRSLNMAQQAAQLPAGTDTTVHDIGRMIALWVSVFEILAHPGGTAKVGLFQVYDLLTNAPLRLTRVRSRRYAAYAPRRRSPKERRSLACWIYGELYKARNDFLHGNPIDIRRLNPKRDRTSLFWIAPSLYRLALTGFLKLRSVQRSSGDFREHELVAALILTFMFLMIILGSTDRRAPQGFAPIAIGLGLCGSRKCRTR